MPGWPAPAGRVSRQLRLLAVGDGTLVDNIVYTSAAQTDYDMSNNQRTGYSRIRSRADVSVSLTPSMSGGVIVGQGMSYTVAVTNNGPWVARSVSTSVSRNSVRVDSASPGCSTSLPTAVFCQFTNVAPGATVYAQVNVTTAHHGSIQNWALVTTDALDTNSGNNTSPTATTVVSALNCSSGSRPNVGLSVSPNGSNSLRVVVTAGTASQPTNALEAIVFGVPVNAAVDVPGYVTNQLAAIAIAFTDRAQSHEFHIRRKSAISPVTVPLTVVDNCGNWLTFVGGGINGFP